MGGIQIHNIIGDRCKSNYHMITTMMATPDLGITIM
jgi:uncharacterized protein YlzI (FlbEa/FlbD family)